MATWKVEDTQHVSVNLTKREVDKLLTICENSTEEGALKFSNLFWHIRGSIETLRHLGSNRGA